MPVFKVCNHDRTKKKLVHANNLQELIRKASYKLDLEEVASAVCLEEDGTEVDDDEILLNLPSTQMQSLLLCGSGQQWQPVLPSVPASPVTPGASSQPVADTVPVTPSKPQTAQSHSTTPVPAASCSTDSPQVTPVRSSNPQATPLRSANGDRVVLDFDLPVFSEYVDQKLKEHRSEVVWHQMIDETARYYLAKCPDIHSYQSIAKKMLEKYPCISREAGKEKWSLFCDTLSQRVRHIRWREGKKSRPSHCGPPKKKLALAAVSPSVGARGTDLRDDPVLLGDNEYQRHLEELANEWRKKEDKRNASHIKMLLKETFNNNIAWIRSLPGGGIRPIIEKIPCYVDGTMVVHDFKQMLTEEVFEHIGPNLTILTQAVERMIGQKQEGKARVLPVVKYIEENTKLDKGRGTKSQPVITVHEDIPDEEVDQLLSSPETSPPSLVVFMQDGEVTGAFVVADGIVIETKRRCLAASLIVLVAAYYVFDLHFPVQYSQILGILQTYVVKTVPYNGKKSVKYVNFATKLKPIIAIVEKERKKAAEENKS